MFFNKSLNTKKIIFNSIGFLLALVLVFSVYYVNNIRFYENFSIEIWQNNKNISNEFHVNGITFFNKNNALELVNNSWHNDYWFYQKLHISSYNEQANDLVVKYQKGKYPVSISVEELTKQEQGYVLSRIVNENNFIDKLLFIIKSRYHYMSALLIIAFLILYFLFLRKLPLFNKIFRLDNVRIVLAILIIISGILIRFLNPSTLNLMYDTGGNIAPVLSMIKFGQFFRMEYSVPYPLFVLTILSIFKNINAVTVFHQILSVLSLIGLFIFVEMKLRTWQLPMNKKRIVSFMLIFVLFVLATNGNLVFYESNLHHEGLIIPSAFLLFFVLSKYFSNTDIERRTLLFSLSIFILFILSFMQYRMVVGFFTVSIFVLIKEINFWRTYKKNRIILSVIIYVFLFCLFYIPDRYLINKYDPKNKSFAHQEVFFSNAQTVLKAINDERLIMPVFDTTILKNHILHVVNNSDKNSFPILGYDFDTLKYRRVLPDFEKHLFLSMFQIDYLEKINTQDNLVRFFYNIFVLEKPDKTEKFKAYSDDYKNYFIEWTYLLLRHYPVDILKKAAKQFTFALFFPGIDYVSYPPKKLFKNPYASDSFYCEYKYLSKNYHFASGKTSNYYFPFSNEIFLQILNGVIRIMFIVFWLYVLVFAFMKKISDIILSMFIIITATLITISFAHTFDIIRYLQTMLPFIMLFILFNVLLLSKKKLEK